MENTMAANTAPAEFAETSAVSTEAEGSVAASNEVSAPAQQQDITQTQAFSKRLNQMSAQKTDAAIKELRMINPYTNSPIESLDQLRAFNAMQQADEQGRDPHGAAELIDLQAQLSNQSAELAEYRMREQIATIKSNADLGEIYEEYKDEINELMAHIIEDGEEPDLESALNVVAAQHIGDIRRREAEKAKAEAMASIAANRAASPGSLAGIPAGGPVNYKDMSDAEFDKVLNAALRGELRKS
jgi:hypothetical protein